MREMEANSVDSIVTDPPYGLAFMGKKWDYNVPSVEIWQECLRVLKPGGHLLAFGGTRTFHRTVVNIENAGFEIRDMIAWIHGQGMPKGFNFSNRIPKGDWCDCESKTEHDLSGMRNPNLSATFSEGQKRNDAVQSCLPKQGISSEEPPEGTPLAVWQQESIVEGREVHRTREGICDDSYAEPSSLTGQRVRFGTHTSCGEDDWESIDRNRRGASHQSEQVRQSGGESKGVCESSRPLDGGTLRDGGRCTRCGKFSQAFQGFDVGLKPAIEPICMARKPIEEKTVAKNVLAHGTGAINVDGCRIETDEKLNGSRNPSANTGMIFGVDKGGTYSQNSLGRFPANLIFDEEAAAALDEMSGMRKTGGGKRNAPKENSVFGAFSGNEQERYFAANEGGASRFFFCAKPSARERGEGNTHPTVKATALMAYLCRLITPPGGLILDPFAGSGTTGIAAIREGFNFVGIEKEIEYIKIMESRIAAANGCGNEP
jgi:site-specific DNA-methyltransferase (adenine-specific)